MELVATAELEPNKTFPTPGERISTIAVHRWEPFLAVLVINEGVMGTPRATMTRYAVINVRPNVYRLTKPRDEGHEEYYVDLSGRFPRCDCPGSMKYLCKHSDALPQHYAAGHLTQPQEST